MTCYNSRKWTMPICEPDCAKGAISDLFEDGVGSRPYCWEWSSGWRTLVVHHIPIPDE
jgi:hypothetical protein